MERLSYFVHNPKIITRTFYVPLLKQFLEVWTGMAMIWAEPQQRDRQSKEPIRQFGWQPKHPVVRVASFSAIARSFLSRWADLQAERQNQSPHKPPCRGRYFTAGVNAKVTSHR